jgi:hypothetical protein
VDREGYENRKHNREERDSALCVLMICQRGVDAVSSTTVRVIRFTFYTSVLWTHCITYHYGICSVSFHHHTVMCETKRASLASALTASVVHLTLMLLNDSAHEVWVNLAKNHCPQLSKKGEFDLALSHIYGIPRLHIPWSSFYGLTMRNCAILLPSHGIVCTRVCSKTTLRVSIQLKNKPF